MIYLVVYIYRDHVLNSTFGLFYTTLYTYRHTRVCMDRRDGEDGFENHQKDVPRRVT